MILIKTIVLSLFVFNSGLALGAESFEPLSPGDQLKRPTQLTWLLGRKPFAFTWQAYDWIVVFAHARSGSFEHILQVLDALKKNSIITATLVVLVDSSPRTREQISTIRDRFLLLQNKEHISRRWTLPWSGHGLVFDESGFFYRHWLLPAGVSSQLPIAFVLAQNGELRAIDSLESGPVRTLNSLGSNWLLSEEFDHHRANFQRRVGHLRIFERSRFEMDRALQNRDWPSVLELADKIEEDGSHVGTQFHRYHARAMKLKAFYESGQHAEHLGWARIYLHEIEKLQVQRGLGLKIQRRAMRWLRVHDVLEAHADLLTSFLQNSSEQEIGRNHVIRRWANSYENLFQFLRSGHMTDYSLIQFSDPLILAAEALNDEELLERNLEIRNNARQRLSCVRILLDKNLDTDDSLLPIQDVEMNP